MSAPTNLSDCYTEELADLWSANDQMTKVVCDLADAAQDENLTDRLKSAAYGIEKHTKTLKYLLDECGESEKEHCKGMEGLVKEARKHALEADIEDPDVRDDRRAISAHVPLRYCRLRNRKSVRRSAW